MNGIPTNYIVYGAVAFVLLAFAYNRGLIGKMKNPIKNIVSAPKSGREKIVAGFLDTRDEVIRVAVGSVVDDVIAAEASELKTRIANTLANSVKPEAASPKA